MPNLDLALRLVAVQQSLAKLRENVAPRYAGQLDQITTDLHALVTEVRATQSAQASERARHDALFNNQHSVMLIIDPETGVIVDANPAACAYYGYSRADLTAKRISDLNTLPPDEVRAEMQRARLFKQNYFNFKHRLASGQIRDVEVSSGAVTLDEHTRLYSIIHDVTDQHRAEDALRQSEEKYRRLFNSAQVGIFRSSIDEGRILEANQKLAQMFGYDCPEDMQAVFLSIAHYVNPADRVRLLAELKDDGSYASVEVPFIRRNGSRLWVIMEVRKDAAAHCIEGMMIDITAHRQTADALIESEAYNRSIVEALSEGVILQQRNGKIIFANASAARILGLPSEQLVGRTELDPHQRIIYPDGSLLPVDAQPAMIALRTGQSVRDVLVGVQRPDGAMAWLSVNAEPLFGLNALEPYAAVTSFADVSLQVQAEMRQRQINEELERRVAERTAALRDSETRYRALIENTVDWVWQIDQDARYVYASPQIRHLLGYQPDEIIGKTPFDLMSTAEASRLMPLFADIQQRRERIEGLENRVRHRDGYEVVLETSGTPVIGEHGEFLGYRGMDRDITQRKQTEEALRASEEQMQLVLEATRDGYWDWDLPTNDLYVSPRLVEMLGYAAKDFEPSLEFWPKLIHPEDWPAVQDATAAHFAGQTPVLEIEHRIRNKAGDWWWAHTRGKVALRDAAGRPVRFVGMMTDITDRKQAEVKLRALLDAMPDMMFLTDAAGVYVDYHAPRTDMLVAPPEAFLGKNMGEVLPLDLARQFQTEIDEVLQLGNSITHEYTLTIRQQAHHYEARLVKCGSDQVLTVVREVTERQQAEAALRESEERFRSLAESMSDILYTLDRDQRHTGVFGSWVERAGLTPDFFLGRTSRDIFGPETAAVHEVASLRALAGEVTMYEWALPGPTGLIHYQTSLSPLRDAHGQIIGLVGVGRDITALRHAEAALRESEALYHTLVETLPMNIFRKDQAGRFTFVNSLFCRTADRSPAEILGKTDFEMYPADLAQKYCDDDQQVMSTAQPLEIIDTHPAPTGQTFYVQTIKSPLYDADSNLIGIQGVFWDITGQKQIELALRESEARYRALFDGINDGIFMHRVRPGGLPGDLIAANHVACQWLGYSREELFTLQMEQYDSMENPEGARWAIEELRRNGQATFERLYVARDGHRFPVEINARRFELNHESVYLAVLRDITQRKQADEALHLALQRERELNHLKTQFVSMVSHEFRTPLTAIQSTADLLQHYGHRFSDEKKHTYLDRIQTAIKRMTTMLDEVLILGRAESGKLEFIPGPIDLEWFCGALIDEFQSTAGDAYTLNLTHTPGCGVLQLDENLLRHILTNLLSNAIKYSPNGGPIDFDVTCAPDHITFKVVDHGIGIPVEGQARLFETFYRANNVGSIQGTGLGLSIVRHAVDLHHGTITFESQPNRGTTFMVTLPLISA